MGIRFSTSGASTSTPPAMSDTDVVAELNRLFATEEPPLPVFPFGPSKMAKIIAKEGVHEAFMMQYVRNHTSISIPTVHHVVPFTRPGNIYPSYAIIMDRVEGETLARAWPKLRWWQKIRIIWTLRSYIRQLRAVPLPNPGVPGPCDGTNQPIRCTGFLSFSMCGGPSFESLDALADWFNMQREGLVILQTHAKTGKIKPFPMFDRSHPLVICHQDLHMGNLMLDRDGKLWVIDWGMAGAYPPWFEYACFANQYGGFLDDEEMSVTATLLFNWFVVGHFPNQAILFLRNLVELAERFFWLPCRTPSYFKKIGVDPDHPSLDLNPEPPSIPLLLLDYLFECVLPESIRPSFSKNTPMYA